MRSSYPLLNQMLNVISFPKHGIKLDAEIKTPQLVICQVANSQKDIETTKMIMLKNRINALHKQKFCEIILWASSSDIHRNLW